MEPELDKSVEDLEDKSNVRKQITTVTPLSKYLAMTLFVILPFIGFWIGLKYNLSQTTPTTPLVYPTQETAEGVSSPLPHEEIEDLQIESTLQKTQATNNEFKVIECNPRYYGEKYFNEARPCDSDMDPEDISREEIALEIIENPTSQNFVLYVSTQRYILMRASEHPSGSTFVIVDLQEQNTVDEFIIKYRRSQIISDSEGFMLFVDYPNTEFSEVVKKYSFGGSVIETLTESGLEDPFTYHPGHDSMPAKYKPAIKGSTDNSVTLSLYNKDLFTQVGPLDEGFYEEVGEVTLKY